jgi:hypothetical protein
VQGSRATRKGKGKGKGKGRAGQGSGQGAGAGARSVLELAYQECGSKRAGVARPVRGCPFSLSDTPRPPEPCATARCACEQESHDAPSDLCAPAWHRFTVAQFVLPPSLTAPQLHSRPELAHKYGAIRRSNCHQQEDSHLCRSVWRTITAKEMEIATPRFAVPVRSARD